MSGGVDSSLTAAILLKQGFEVIGVTMLLENEHFHEKSCCSSKEVETASNVAQQLGIKFHVVDLREKFRKYVMNYFAAEYFNGRTPNPCVQCNQKIKYSQEVCFVPNGDYKIFLREFLPNSEALQSGKIVDSTGKILGEHDGVSNYTIGQRKGLGIYSSRALYVKKIDVSERKIVVDTNENLYSRHLTARNVLWIYKPTLPEKLTAKIRYGIRFAECFVTEEENFLNVEFTEPQRAVTPGQSIVFYDGDEVLGGAIIEGSF